MCVKNRRGEVGGGTRARILLMRLLLLLTSIRVSSFVLKSRKVLSGHGMRCEGCGCLEWAIRVRVGAHRARGMRGVVPWTGIARRVAGLGVQRAEGKGMRH